MASYAYASDVDTCFLTIRKKKGSVLNIKISDHNRDFLSQACKQRLFYHSSCFLFSGYYTKMEEQVQRVLSIQSHVVSGYVGNKSASFPLQVLGFEVDTINSVQFSNHTGYGFWTGQVLAAKDIDDLMEGLRKNKINQYSHLLTGYMASESFLLKIVDVVKELKTVNPDLIYVCDPVMGDNGSMYVPSELLPIYQEQVIPLADIITPNQYEAELLTGIKISSEKDAFAAMEAFHSKGIKTVVLSSTELGSKDHLIGLASSRQGDKKEAVRIEIPKFPGTFTGTGDLFAALFLAWMTRTGGDLKKAIEITIGTMQDVLKRTLQYAQGAAGDGNKPLPYQIELRMIQSKADIESTRTTVTATRISI